MNNRRFTKCWSVKNYIKASVLKKMINDVTPFDI